MAQLAIGTSFRCWRPSFGQRHHLLRQVWGGLLGACGCAMSPLQRNPMGQSFAAAIVLEQKKETLVTSPGGDFLELILNCKNKFLDGNMHVIKSPLSFSGWEGGRREERRGGRRRGWNIPCNSLAVAMNVPCATSHSNASKLDAVFVDQCFVQCLLA